MRDGRLTFPRRPNHACQVEEYGCNPKLHALRDGLERGMAAGALRIPDGLPLLVNVEDPSQCPGTVRRALPRGPACVGYPARREQARPPLRPRLRWCRCLEGAAAGSRKHAALWLHPPRPLQGPADSACTAPVLSYAKHEPHLDVLMPVGGLVGARCGQLATGCGRQRWPAKRARRPAPHWPFTTAARTPAPLPTTSTLSRGAATRTFGLGSGSWRLGGSGGRLVRACRWGAQYAGRWGAAGVSAMAARVAPALLAAHLAP